MAAKRRLRHPVNLTLSDEARGVLVALTATHPDRTASAVVEDLLLAARVVFVKSTR